MAAVEYVPPAALFQSKTTAEAELAMVSERTVAARIVSWLRTVHTPVKGVGGWRAALMQLGTCAAKLLQSAFASGGTRGEDSRFSGTGKGQETGAAEAFCGQKAGGFSRTRGREKLAGSQGG